MPAYFAASSSFCLLSSFRPSSRICRCAYRPRNQMPTRRPRIGWPFPSRIQTYRQCEWVLSCAERVLYLLLRPLSLCQLDCGLATKTQIQIFRALWRRVEIAADFPASSMCWPRSLGAFSDERSLLTARGCFWIPPIARPRPWSGFGTRRSRIG